MEISKRAERIAEILDNKKAQDIVILKPQNPNFEPRELKDTEVQILGRVTGLLRKM